MNDPMGDSPVIQRAPTRKPAAKKAKKPVRRVARAVEHADVHVTRNSPRPAPRAEAARDASRDPARKAVRNGAVIAVGHGGETLTRRRTTVGDAFAVPMNEIPTGWTYQWNTVTVLNQNLKEIERGDLMMHENGWRPVPASRHPGRWAPHGYEGSIIIDGLRLEERPASLTNEALEEDKARGKAQVRDRTDALRLTQKQLPGANQARNSRVGPQMGMRMSIDPALDVPRGPDYELDDGFGE